MQVGVLTKLDGIDANQIRDMVASKPFQDLTARISGELERQRTACEQSDDPAAIHRAQGAVLALRTVLSLPDKMLKEIASQGKR